MSTTPANPKFLSVLDGILLIRQEIIQNSVSSYWEQIVRGDDGVVLFGPVGDVGHGALEGLGAFAEEDGGRSVAIWAVSMDMGTVYNT